MAAIPYHGKIKHHSALSGIIMPILLFSGVVILFWIGTESLSTGSVKRQRESLSDALSRDVVYCYAMTGRYPESLEYIKQNYGLLYNEELFYVDYQVRGSNILPDMTIIDLVDNENAGPVARMKAVIFGSLKVVFEERQRIRTNIYQRVEENGFK